MKLNLDTIIIFVQNVDKLKDFYVDILKLEIAEQSGSEWLLLKAGSCNIGLHKIGQQYLDENPAVFKFENNTKIIFDLDENIYEIRELLLKQDVFIKEVTSFENYDFFLCDGEDPEGNVFQLRQKKK